jgi:hypothetical protein
MRQVLCTVLIMYICGQNVNSWLDGKLAVKGAAQPRLAIGQ